MKNYHFFKYHLFLIMKVSYFYLYSYHPVTVKNISYDFYYFFSRNSDWDENDNDFIASDGSVQHSSSGSNNSDSSDALGWFYRSVFIYRVSADNLSSPFIITDINYNETFIRKSKQN